jgi:hypothetical protein
MRVYADFNAAVDGGGPDRPMLVDLAKLGTLRDLCAARLRLTDGLQLTVYTDSSEEEDLEADAVVRWLPTSGHTGGGRWVAEFDPGRIRDVPATSSPSVTAWFPCSACGTNLAADIQQARLSAGSQCGMCGTRVWAPILPPGEPARLDSGPSPG